MIETKIFLAKLKKDVKSSDYVKFILSKYYGYDFENITIEKSTNGKPFIKKSDIKYSLSHKGDYIISIFCNQEVGIDMEIIQNKDRDKMTNRLFLYDEIDYVNSSNLDRELRFLEIWTKKEAYIKRHSLNMSYIKKVNVLNEKIYTFNIEDLIVSVCI